MQVRNAILKTDLEMGNGNYPGTRSAAGVKLLYPACLAAKRTFSLKRKRD